MGSRNVRYDGPDVVAAGEAASIGDDYARGRFGRVTCGETQSRVSWYGKEWRGSWQLIQFVMGAKMRGKDETVQRIEQTPSSDISRGKVGEERGKSRGLGPRGKHPGELVREPHGSPPSKVSLACPKYPRPDDLHKTVRVRAGGTRSRHEIPSRSFCSGNYPCGPPHRRRPRYRCGRVPSLPPEVAPGPQQSSVCGTMPVGGPLPCPRTG